jgi:hypothetical protein
VEYPAISTAAAIPISTAAQIMKRGVLRPSFDPRSNLQLANSGSSNDFAVLTGMTHDIFYESMRRLAYWARENLPIPSRTWRVLMPGLGVERPALEMCM